MRQVFLETKKLLLHVSARIIPNFQIMSRADSFSRMTRFVFPFFPPFSTHHSRQLCYNVDDLLPLCQELNIPLVFDYHHDWIYPSSRPPAELIPEINALWTAKGIRPKQHYSEPRPGAQTAMEKRAHADRVARLPPDLPDDMGTFYSVDIYWKAIR